MKTNLIKAVLIIGCLFVGITTKAQNPLTTKANIIMQFDISPNNRWVCCSWWGADYISKIRIKDLNTQKVIDVDSLSLITKSPFYGVSFLSDNQLLFVKEKALFSYNLKTHSQSKLFDISADAILPLTTTKDGKGIYLICDESICYAKIEGGIENKKHAKDLDMLEISTTPDNQVIYSTSVEQSGKDVHQVWSWDGQNQSSNLTDQFSKEVKSPYIVEATSDLNLYIVVGTEGAFRFNKSTQKATKLIDNPKEDPVVEVRMSDDNKTLYYRTYYQKAVIKTVDMDGKQGKSILF